jgi:hydrogenase maturation protein HypF
VERLKITVGGIVQGVGFRPFVFVLAKNLNLTGNVFNTSLGVQIEVQGPSDKIKLFLSELSNNPPSAAQVESVILDQVKTVRGENSFSILESLASKKRQAISPDLATCLNCEEEVFNDKDRRYGYPFTNCYNCGPRFTIIKKMPYDRINTSMDKFKLCPDCQAEYNNPLNRRFHAEPIACSVCGPQVVLLGKDGYKIEGNFAKNCADFLAKEKILAIKGIGGFNLACIATSSKAIKKIRKHKSRPVKPLALMVSDLNQARQICTVSKIDEKILCSKEAPIVLLPKIENNFLSEQIAPGQKRLGVMLANTPLHKLIIKEIGLPLVMTSANLNGEPIITDNEEVQKKLTFADYFLVHDRDILTGYDDSVVINSEVSPRIIRIGRGYAPKKINWVSKMPPILALGGDLKNSFALAYEGSIFLSQYLGDLENYENFLRFEKTLSLFKKLFKVEPKIIVADMHPNYVSSRWARKQNKQVLLAQHHKAHVASVMVEENIRKKVVGVCFDGLGYGEDGHLWGGEFLVGNLNGFFRAGHFDLAKMPGLDLANKDPQRMAYSYLVKSGLSKEDIINYFKDQERNLNDAYKASQVSTSSVGRIFDAVAYLLGFKGLITFEGEAALFVENIADNKFNDFYPYEIKNLKINFDAVFINILRDIAKNKEKSLIAAKFQNTVVNAGANMVGKIADKEGLDSVVLSGGVFQNIFVLEKLVKTLEYKNLNVYFNNKVPVNDAGLALGQIGLALGEVNVLGNSR